MITTGICKCRPSVSISVSAPECKNRYPHDKETCSNTGFSQLGE